MSTEDSAAGTTGTSAGREKIDLAETLFALALISVPGWALQLIATDMSPLQALGGMLGLYTICVVGLLLTRFVPLALPSVAWISLVGILASLPVMPWAQAVLDLVGEIDFLALSVPCLAFAGLAISHREISVMKRSGFKLLLVALLVLIGTYLGSVVIADGVLRLTG